MFNLLDYKRDRGRPQKSWNEVIRHDLELLRLTDDFIHVRSLRKSKIKVANRRELVSWHSLGFRKVRSVDEL